jgi:hypothetical protein
VDLGVVATVALVVVDAGRVVEFTGAVVEALGGMVDVTGAVVAAVVLEVVGTEVVGAEVVGAEVVGAVVAGVVGATVVVSEVPNTVGFVGAAVEIDRSPMRPNATTRSRIGTIATAKKARSPRSSLVSAGCSSIRCTRYAAQSVRMEMWSAVLRLAAG